MASSLVTPQDTNAQEGNSWQFNKSVIECNRHMLDTGLAADVTFLVLSSPDGKGTDDVCIMHAHKYVLISRSPVFYSMLCGDLAETGEIRVTDVDPQAFRQMLNYIYTDTLDLRPDVVMCILYASKKYMLPGLTVKCTDYLKNQLDCSNTCIILDQSLLFDENDLAEQCMNLIKQHTDEAFSSDYFTGVSQNALTKILDSEKFTIKEVDVFKACLKWADVKCQEQNMETTGANRKKVLGDCLTKLRYSDINIGEFATVVSPSEILTKEEEVWMLRHLANKESYPVAAGFSSTSRYVSCGPYEIITTEKIEKALLLNTIFQITFVCDTDIKVNAFVIGTWLPFVCRHDNHGKPFSTTTSLSSVSHNDVNVPGRFTRQLGGRKQEWACKNQLILMTGETMIQMNYQSNKDYEDSSDQEELCAMDVLPNNEIVLSDDRIKIKLTSNQPWMPILGLKYDFV